MQEKAKKFPWAILLLMSAVTFMAILSELVPSGVLPQLAEALHIDLQEAGLLVGGYALASAIFAIPMISLTITLNRKTLLLVLLVGFGLTNILVVFSTSYVLTMALRVIGGICAGVLWPMISVYGMATVDEAYQGRAIAIVMAGSTLGMSVGLPLFTFIGNQFGFPTEFCCLGGLALAVAAAGFIMWPGVAGEARTKGNSPLTIVKQREILVVMLLTLLAICGHYGLYIYITQLVEFQRFLGGIEMAQILFGVGSLVSVFLAAKYVDTKLYFLIDAAMGLGVVTLLLFHFFGQVPYVSHAAFFLWGIAFGPLVTLFQAATTRQVDEGKSVATSLQSSLFNFAIMIGSALGGYILGAYGLEILIPVCAAIVFGAFLTSFFGKRILKSA